MFSPVRGHQHFDLCVHIHKWGVPTSITATTGRVLPSMSAFPKEEGSRLNLVTEDSIVEPIPVDSDFAHEVRHLIKGAFN